MVGEFQNRIMVYKIPRKKIMQKKTSDVIFDYKALDGISFLEYGNKFSELGKKEQKEIAKKYVRGDW